MGFSPQKNSAISCTSLGKVTKKKIDHRGRRTIEREISIGIIEEEYTESPM